MKSMIRNWRAAMLRLRARRAPEFRPQGPVVIVAPHPDDEVIGCGGLISRLVGEGRPPHIIVMTGGEGSHSGCCTTPRADIVAARRALTRDAARSLGLPETNIHELNYPDGRIASSNPETESLRALLAELQPATLLVPHWGEGWSDHLRTAEIAAAVAPDGAEVVEYCVWMWYYNVWRLNWSAAAVCRLIPEEHAAKRAAVDAYVLPAAPCGRPWSGVLPAPFLRAAAAPLELYFRKQISE